MGGVVITTNVVLDAVETGPDHPLILWDNIVTDSNIAADTAADGYPASNMAAPITFREWRANDANAVHVTITTDGVTEIDSVALAMHNLGTIQAPVSVEEFVSGSWSEVAAPAIFADDAPILWRFTPGARSQVRIRIQAGNGDENPRIAVVYCGKLLIMERRIWSGHVPMPLGRKTKISNGRSESGQFLGRILLGTWRETSAAFRLLTPAWVRETLNPFLAAAPTTPFFFAWRPSSYPLEVGYAQVTDDPIPANGDASDSNLLTVTFNMTGVA